MESLGRASCKNPCVTGMASQTVYAAMCLGASRLGGTFLRCLKFFCAWRFFCRQTSDLCLLPLGRVSTGLPAAAVAVLSSASSDADEERWLPAHMLRSISLQLTDACSMLTPMRTFRRIHNASLALSSPLEACVHRRSIAPCVTKAAGRWCCCGTWKGCCCHGVSAEGYALCRVLPLTALGCTELSLTCLECRYGPGAIMG